MVIPQKFKEQLSNMVKELKDGQTVPSMKEIGEMELSMGRVNNHKKTQMLSILEIG